MRVRGDMYLGLDIGTSAVKAVICDRDQKIVVQAESSLVVSRPKPQWSEQNPEAWWQAIVCVFEILRRENAAALSEVVSIGLAGQMHGAVLLDADGGVLRPAILWNDGRSAAECSELEMEVTSFREKAGNIAMAGFTSPKILWLKKHEPKIFKKIAKVLLPKDYIRYRLTGDYVSDMSDASGTLWMDISQRKWSKELVEASGLSLNQMSRLVEGTEASGHVMADLAGSFGMRENVIVAGGAGDNAGGAVGIGAVEPGRAFLSLGTSGVLFLSNQSYAPNPADAVHAFCHCLPNTWHQMSVILSAASCLSWVTKLTGANDETSLLADVAANGTGNNLIFLPYLSGERTPHNDPDACGVFFGLTHDTESADLGRAVLEGVAFAFADGMDALKAAGGKIKFISVIGGGSRSELWGQILADTLNCELHYHEAGEVGPAFGAARIARLAANDGSVSEVCSAPEIRKTIKPDEEARPYYQQKLKKYRRLYASLQQEFAA